MPLRMRSAALVSAACFLIAAIAAPATAGAADKSLVDAATKEGRVMAYGSLITPTWRAIQAGFDKQYPGIKMDFLYLSGAPMLNRLMTELDAGRHIADVFALDVDRLPPLQQKGYIESYSSTEQAHYGLEWQSKPPGLWIQNHSYLAGIIYNKKLVPKDEAPKSFQDLLAPKWHGKIAMISPISNDLMLYMFAGLIRDMGRDRAFAWMKGLAAQNPYVLGPGGLPVSQGVNTGQFPIGLGFLGHVYSVGGGENGTMGIVPTDPTYAVIGPGIGLLKGAPHPNAARLLVDYMNSRAVQQMVVNLGYFSHYPGVDAPPSLMHLKVVPAPTPTGQDAQALRDKLRDIFGL